MKQLLKSLYEWLDRKFPDVVVITAKEYNELNDRIMKLESVISAERMKAIESEINKFNMSLGFGGTIERNTRQPFQR